MRLKAKVVSGSVFLVMLTLGVLVYTQHRVSDYYTQDIVEKTSENISKSLINNAQIQVEQMMAYLSDALINPFYRYDLTGVQALLEPALNNKNLTKIQVFDSQGNIFHDGSESILVYGEPIKHDDLKAAVLEQRKVFTVIEGDTIIMACPLILGHDVLGGLLLEYSLEEVYQNIRQNQTIIEATHQTSTASSAKLFFGIAILLFLMSLTLALVLSNGIVRPIEQLVRHANRIGIGQHGIDNDVQRNDELGTLAHSFNDMDKNLKERTEAIEFLAYHDVLTRLPNRAQFMDFLNKRIDHGLKHNRPFAVLFIDLDEFKGINDNLGHSAGDELLCTVANSIKAEVEKRANPHRDQTTYFISRVGGDEFLMCLPNLEHFNRQGIGQTEQVIVSNLAKQLISTLSKPIWLEKSNESVVVGASIGIALYPQAGQSSEQLVKHADIAMYNAKNSGKGQFCFFNEEMEKEMIYRNELEKELRLAMEDYSAFHMYYQPKIELNSGRIIGAEALIRWIHPTRGHISPDVFIKIAESTGMIIPLGEWIVKQVAKDMHKIYGFCAHQDFHLALNVSAKQLYGSKVARLLNHQLITYQLPPHCLHVEVTETLLMQDRQTAKENLDKIRALGIEIWLDDFGTGYSSLGYLLDFNIDGIKIDRSFVNDITTDKHSQALCSAIINMAKKLDIKVVAEGVEEIEQSNYLLNEECDYAQGYFYSRPIALNEFIVFLEESVLNQTRPHVL
ncbi:MULTISPECIES: EAL domain-containing protein [unclassified Vibrio]|uniref:EAL domain-containing protein n=1 Tax=Vibrio sp. HB236076 TaxID=3232307 RepID=A0AB39HFA9_9VIBR|nr:EAL domain-containing protein [Vibrio sp. HB161653]MDP5255573.1 EAL domain-containing protein [Vibrio sp. HB161653]